MSVEQNKAIIRRIFHIYRLDGGKAVEHRVDRDDMGAMRRLGVIPDPFSASQDTAVNR